MARLRLQVDQHIALKCYKRSLRNHQTYIVNEYVWEMDELDLQDTLEDWHSQPIEDFK